MQKVFSKLTTDSVEITKICGLTAPKFIKWQYRRDIVEMFKKYNRGRGKLSKEYIIQYLSRIPKEEYGIALMKLIDYVENV